MSMCNALSCCIGGARATEVYGAIYIHGQLYRSGFVSVVEYGESEGLVVFSKTLKHQYFKL